MAFRVFGAGGGLGGKHALRFASLQRSPSTVRSDNSSVTAFYGNVVSFRSRLRTLHPKSNTK